MPRGFRIALVLVGAAVLGGSAVSVRPLSLKDLCTGSDTIVLAGVQGVECAWDAQQAKIETNVTLIPLETWKGNSVPQIQVRVPGGTVGNITQKCSEAPAFQPNDVVVCFLHHRNGVAEVYGWFRGKYTVLDGQVREIPDTTLGAFQASVMKLVNEGR